MDLSFGVDLFNLFVGKQGAVYFEIRGGDVPAADVLFGGCLCCPSSFERRRFS
jgi:hypothetical protein